MNKKWANKLDQVTKAIDQREGNRDRVITNTFLIDILDTKNISIVFIIEGTHSSSYSVILYFDFLSFLTSFNFKNLTLTLWYVHVSTAQQKNCVVEPIRLKSSESSKRCDTIRWMYLWTVSSVKHSSFHFLFISCVGKSFWFSIQLAWYTDTWKVDCEEI
jgi:hypothetical protein